MALQRLVIQNFQSLKKVDIELGRFTVIVGASSSGKSALLRAVRALASGIRGNSFITVGATTAAISAYTEDHIVTLEKSKTKARYVITDRKTGEEEKFTKLNSSVPEHVTDALKLVPIVKDQASINFAGQHDMPYLLTDSAAQVAKVLGDLTNVSTIFEAVRQANRQKTATSSLLKTRQADLDGLTEQAQQFSGLAARRKAVEAAESELQALEEQEGRRVRLQALTASVETSQGLLGNYQQLPDLPDLASLEDIYAEYERFKSSVVSWASSYKAVQSLSAQLELSEKEEKLAHSELHDKLSQLGTCPTCGQVIREENFV